MTGIMAGINLAAGKRLEMLRRLDPAVKRQPSQIGGSKNERNRF